MSAPNKFDDTLFEILKDCKTLPVFLNTVFGFLKRRTDFYEELQNSCTPVGLPPGAAEGIVKHTFFKWQNEKNAPEEPSKPQQLTPVPDKQFTKSDSYNGAVYENYSWSQSISDVDIIVKIPENTTGKQLEVLIQSQKICVKLKNSDATLLTGELCRKIKSNDVIWSIDGTKLDIHFDKCAEVWWDCLVTSEAKLDVNKIDCSRPFEELSEEAQAKIAELTWNQERKRLGLPTSEQMDMENKLKKSWDADGSPFSGPFDPASVVMN